MNAAVMGSEQSNETEVCRELKRETPP